MREGHMRARDRHVDTKVVDGSEYEHRRREDKPDVSGAYELQTAIILVRSNRAE